jgi:hypothetical protein
MKNILMYISNSESKSNDKIIDKNVCEYEKFQVSSPAVDITYFICQTLTQFCVKHHLPPNEIAPIFFKMPLLII